MDIRRRFLWVVYSVIIVICVGITGYMFIEGWSFVDALYMTVITLSTVGYEEVHGLSDAGKIFSTVLIVFGVGVMLYGLTNMVQYFIEGQFLNIWGRRRMKDKISKLTGHIILCGYGQVGRQVAREFENEGIPFVVIDQNQESITEAADAGLLYLQGNATSDEVLKDAGIERARALVAALGTDADNLYVTLSSRELRSDLFIVARASTEESEPKLQRAGANRTMSPYRIGGRRMAMLTLRPLVVDFVDTTMHSRGRELVLENVKVHSGSPVEGKTVIEGEQQCKGISILAVRKKDGRLLANPYQETLLEQEDELVVIGTREQLRGLEGSILREGEQRQTRAGTN
jgi:voltage-gated potassium channel